MSITRRPPSQDQLPLRPAGQLAPHVVRLRPAPHCRTPILAYSLKVTPEQHFMNWQQDPFGNYQARLVFPQRDRASWSVEVDLVAETDGDQPVRLLPRRARARSTRSRTTAGAERRARALPASSGAVGPRLDALVGGASRRDRARRTPHDRRAGRHQPAASSDLLRYDIRMEPGVFAPEETLERGHGSCRDFAWLLVQLLRRLGLARASCRATRSSSRPTRSRSTGPTGVAEDVTDLHAWAEVFLPGAGWVGLDATSGLLCGEGHIPLACTADPTSAAPITGSSSPVEPSREGRRGRATKFAFAMTRHAHPRGPARHQAVHRGAVGGDRSPGRRGRRRAVAGDVRLTMGGEPTFVSIDDPDGAEWNTAALGPTKRQLAE